MSRSQLQRLDDIRASCEAIVEYLLRDVSDTVIFDAIRIRLVEIGEAVKGLSADTRNQEPGIPWEDITRMRDLLAHRYFDTTHAIVENTARNDIPELLAAVERLLIVFGSSRRKPEIQ